MVLLLCVAGAAQANLPSAKNPPSPVAVPFFASARQDGQAQTLTTSDLLIWDNKMPVKSIIAVGGKELPLRLGVLVDTSGSQAENDLYQPGLQAASDFLNQLPMGPQDRVFILTFAAGLSATGFMKHDELVHYKADLSPYGKTSLFDAIYFACKQRMEPDATQPARRVLIVLSDGGDDRSKVSRDKAIAAAQEAGTVIFAVSTRNSVNGFRDNTTMEALGDETGGRTFLHPGRISKPFSDIGRELGSMYVVSFVPASPGRAGQRHSIQLKEAPHKKLKIRAPRGYYVAAAVK